MSGLAIVNKIVPQISLPTKGTWSNNCMPFTGNYYPTQLTGTGLVSKTALDYVPKVSAATINYTTPAKRSVIEAYLAINDSWIA